MRLHRYHDPPASLESGQHERAGHGDQQHCRRVLTDSGNQQPRNEYQQHRAPQRERRNQKTSQFSLHSTLLNSTRRILVASLALFFLTLDYCERWRKSASMS